MVVSPVSRVFACIGIPLPTARIPSPRATPEWIGSHEITTVWLTALVGVIDDCGGIAEVAGQLITAGKRFASIVTEPGTSILNSLGHSCVLHISFVNLKVNVTSTSQCF
jgi:hypothetical protein